MLLRGMPLPALIIELANLYGSTYLLSLLFSFFVFYFLNFSGVQFVGEEVPLIVANVYQNLVVNLFYSNDIAPFMRKLCDLREQLCSF